MRTGSDQAGDPPAATQRAEPAADPPDARGWLVTWHGDLLAQIDQLDWLREAGLSTVDCFWMQAGHAIYGGYR